MSTAGTSTLTAEQRSALVEKIRAGFAQQRSRGQTPVSATPDETLAELERDAHAERTVKWDVRTTPEEKLRWAEAASTLGLWLDSRKSGGRLNPKVEGSNPSRPIPEAPAQGLFSCGDTRRSRPAFGSHAERLEISGGRIVAAALASVRRLS